jgi:polygalacturonase
MAVNLSLVAGAGWQFFTDSGVPLTGGKLYTYSAGTTTPVATYTTSAGNVANTNPIVLDAAGRVSSEIWITEGTSCKFVLKSSTEVQIWSHDNIQGAGDFSEEIAAVYTDLANTSNVAKGDALVGFKQSNTAGVLANAVARTVHQKFQSYVDVKDFGALGDGVQDDTTYIQNALNSVSATNGGRILISDGVYKITNVLLMKSNTVLEFVGTLKVTAMPTGGFESVLATNPPTGASNITILNPQIDLNNIVPASGILIRYTSQNIRIEGGYIRNGLNSVTYSGGRGINIEGGYTPTNVTVSGTIIENCWEGVSLSGGTGQESSNISISNLTLNYCQSAIGLSGNAATYPHSGAYMQGVFSNISIRNCGVVTTYSRQAGVINSDRGSNVMFNNIYIYNNPAYGTPDSLWRGDANNICMTNVTMEGDLGGSMFNFSSYQEANSFPLATYSSLNSVFSNIKCTGTIPDIIVVPIVGASYLTNCQFDVLTNVVTSNNILTSSLSNKTNVFIKAQNKTNNSILSGYCSDIYPYYATGTTFSAWANKEKSFSLSGVAPAWALIDGTTGTVNRGLNITCTRVSTGQYTIAFTTPFPTVSYVVLVQATAPNASAVQADQVSAKLGTGFTLQTSSANSLIDKALINIAIYY